MRLVLFILSLCPFFAIAVHEGIRYLKKDTDTFHLFSIQDFLTQYQPDLHDQLQTSLSPQLFYHFEKIATEPAMSSAAVLGIALIVFFQILCSILRIP